MKLVYIVGNRPQFIKLAILHRQVKKHSFIQEHIIHTGQHYSDSMSTIFFNDLDIDLAVSNLNIHSCSSASMIGKMMIALEEEISNQHPDIIVVFGDTHSTLAGALTANKMRIPLAHIEAGIRTFDNSMPEESNRIITDRIADLNFCCTHLGMEHLQREGFNTSKISSTLVNSGDLMLDAFLHYQPKINSKPELLKNLPVPDNGYVLFTLHRRQNIEEVSNLASILSALSVINEEIKVVWPVHPYTKKIMEDNGLSHAFVTLPPIGYFDMQYLLQHAAFVITDSGGLQREAFFAQKPTLILMEQPFWPEVLQYGTALKCAAVQDEICKQFEALKSLPKSFDVSVFGNGNAASIITHELIRYYQHHIKHTSNGL